MRFPLRPFLRPRAGAGLAALLVGVTALSGLASLPAHAGKFGKVYGPFAGLCLEPQARPDSPNRADWPSVWHAPGSVVTGRIEYRFRSMTAGA